MPTIPTFNDTEEEIAEIARFAHDKMHVEEINLLPYHQLGRDKYGWLGRDYGMGELEPPSDEKMQRLKAVAEQCGMKAKIGG